MVYDYAPDTDTFYLREGSAEDPRSIEDCYQGDKAGSFANHARTGITGTDGAGVDVDYALKPADYIVLGGASEDLWLLIENWTNMTSATIRIIGTDRDENSQTEDVAISGNGTYYTTKWFKTVTQTQVTAFSGTGSFDYKLEQGQFGAISKLSSKHYVVHSNFWLWDYGSYSAGLALEDVAVLFEKDLVTYYRNSCYLRLGNILNGRGIAGAKVHVLGSQTYTYGILKHYASISNLKDRDGRNEIVDSILLASFRTETVDDIFKRVTIYNSFGYDKVLTTPPEDVLIHNPPLFGVMYGVDNERIWNMTIEYATNDLLIYGITVYMRDCSWDRGISFSGPGGRVYDEYTLNLKVTDKNESGISGVSVKAYKNGDYTDLEPNDGATPVLDTSTDGNGKIPEQGLIQWEHENGQSPIDYNPFLWILEHPNYDTKKFIITMPRKKLEDGDWIYAYAEEETGTHEQILSAISKHDKKLTGLVA